MKHYIQKMFIVICTVALFAPVIAASENNRYSADKKEAMTNQYRKIVSRLDNLELNIVDILAQIAMDIESLSITRKTDSTAWKEQRKAKLELWLKALDKLSRMMDVKFNPEDLPRLNIAPPLGVTGLRAGVSSSEIKDPKLRKQYEQALMLNAEKAERYRFQNELRKLDKDWSSKVRSYIKSQYSSDAQDIKEINTLIDLQFSGSPRKEQLKEAFLGGRDVKSPDAKVTEFKPNDQ